MTDGPSGQPSQAQAVGAAGRYSRRIAGVLALTGAYMLAEVAGGLLTGSLALLADAGHMAIDVFGLGLSLLAFAQGNRPASPQRTYGYYRTEILAALLNAALLFVVSGYVVYEAWRRFQAPPEVQSLPMLVVASLGLAVNVVGVWLLRSGVTDSLNVRGAFLEVFSDLLNSLGVIVAGLVMYFTGWWYADPLFGVLIGLFIIPRTWRLLTEAVGILLEGTPSHLRLAEVQAAMEGIPGVKSLHDLHVWSITSGYVALSTHVQVGDGVDGKAVLADLQALLKERFAIEHTTLQIVGKAFEENQPHH